MLFDELNSVKQYQTRSNNVKQVQQRQLLVMFGYLTFILVFVIIK